MPLATVSEHSSILWRDSGTPTEIKQEEEGGEGRSGNSALKTRSSRSATPGIIPHRANHEVRLSVAGRKSEVRMALDCARLRASLELEGGDSLMEQTTAPASSCSSSCCDSCRLKAMASAAN